MSRYYLIVVVILLTGCTKSGERVKTSIDSASGQSIKKEILAFSDSVDEKSLTSVQQQSLVYTLNDYSFHVSRYIKDSEVSMYVERGSSTNFGDVEDRYYLKDGQVILFIHQEVNAKKRNPFKSVRYFYSNGDFLFSEERTAETLNNLTLTGYSPSEAAKADVIESLRKLNDAIYQRGKFDLLLEGITEYPKAKYLILSRNNFNSYRAALLVKKEDDLIKSIDANPEKYRGRKLDVTWDLKNGNEAVYISGALGD